MAKYKAIDIANLFIQLFNLFLSFFGEDGGSAFLYDVGDSVGLGGAVSYPHGVQVELHILIPFFGMVS